MKVYMLNNNNNNNNNNNTYVVFGMPNVVCCIQCHNNEFN